MGKVVERQFPSNVEAEQGVLGSILLEPARVFSVDLEPKEFYLEKHRWIYEAMRAAIRDGKDADFLTIAARLEEEKHLEQVGGAAYLVALLNGMPTASLIQQYAGLVRREFIKRQLVLASTEIAELAYDCAEVATEDLVTRANGKLQKIQTLERGKAITVSDAIYEYLPTFNEFLDEKREVWGISTGLDIDKYIGGLMEGDFWIIAGDPGKGKTSLAMQIAVQAAMRDAATVVFSMEMTKTKLMDRLFAMLGNVNSEAIRRGKITEMERRQIMDAVMELDKAPLWIVEQSQSTSSIRAQVAQMQQRGIPVRVVIADYLRLLTDTAVSEDKRVDDICRAFKLIARDFNVTAILVHALNRSGEGLNRLKYGGGYDPDVAIICDFENNRKNYDAVIEIEKNRNGDTPDVKMVYRGEVFRWENPALNNPFRMNQMRQPNYVVVGAEENK